MIRKNGIYVITQTNLCHTVFPKYLFNKSVICKGTVWGKEMEKSLVLTVYKIFKVLLKNIYSIIIKYLQYYSVLKIRSVHGLIRIPLLAFSVL